MKNIINLVLAILVLAFTTTYNVLANDSSTRVAFGAHNDFTVSYMLPKSVFVIDITTTRECYTAGPYADYANKYLGVSSAITEDRDVWKFISATATAIGVVNGDTTYSVQLKGDTPYVLLDKDGALRSINCEPSGSVIYPDDLIGEDGEVSPLNNNSSIFNLSEEILQSASTVKMAELVARQIYRLRESRVDLVTGESEHKPDGEALKIMLQNINEKESQLTALFMGSVTTSTKHTRFIWEPTAGVEREVVARISKSEGVVDADNLSGEPIYIDITDVVTAKVPVDKKGIEIKLPENAVIYNMPGEARLSLSFGGESVFSKKFAMSQYGITFGLNPTLFTNKKSMTFIELTPETGGINAIGRSTQE